MSALAERAAELSGMNKDRLVLIVLAKENECAELIEARGNAINYMNGLVAEISAVRGLLGGAIASIGTFDRKLCDHYQKQLTDLSALHSKKRPA